MLTGFKRVARLGLISFWRNGLVSVASLSVMVITLFVLGGIILSRAFLLASLDELKSKVDISVAFKETTTEAEVLALKQKLTLLPEVTSITYSSREEELVDFRERNKDNSLLLQSLEEVENPFGARLNIIAADPANYESLVAFLETEDGLEETGGAGIIYDISFKKDVVNKLNRFIEVAQKAGWAIILVLGFSSVVVTFATISLAIYVSREEVSVMRLVGAQNSYIRGPFLVECLIVGLIAAFVALILLYPATVWLHQLTVKLAVPIDLLSYYLSHLFKLILLLSVVGAGLGIVSSFLALRKHLRV